MKEKELRRLSRIELLELLWAQTKENELLSAKVAELEEKLRDRQIRIAKAGSLAQASMDINGVFEAAQAAARQYVDNIALVEEETRAECARLIAEARDEAERIRSGARENHIPEGEEIPEVIHPVEPEARPEPIPEPEAEPRQELPESRDYEVAEAAFVRWDEGELDDILSLLD